MDVIVPAIPADYDGYRAALRAFIAEHRPVLEWKQRSGLRVPDRVEDVEALRAYVRAVLRRRVRVGPLPDRAR